MTDVHHIIKKQLFDRLYMKKYEWFKNHELNLIEIDHYVHINLVHGGNVYALESLCDLLHSRISEMFMNNKLSEECLHALTDVYLWATIGKWDKTQIPFKSLDLITEELKPKETPQKKPKRKINYKNGQKNKLFKFIKNNLDENNEFTMTNKQIVLSTGISVSTIFYNLDVLQINDLIEIKFIDPKTGEPRKNGLKSKRVIKIKENNE